MKTMVVLAVQIAALVVLNEVGHVMAGGLGLPLPGNLIGMLLLLALLVTGVVPPRWVESSASLLLRHLGFFFVPITVGLVGFAELFRSDGPAILLTLVVSAAVGICVAGLVSQRLRGRREEARP